jgi:hypothetical protein
MGKAHPNGDGTNKADMVREILAHNPKATVKEVQKMMAERGLTVSENHVYFIRSKLRDQKNRRKRAAAAETTRATGMPNPATAVSKVKALARELGGLRNLKQLVDVLAE